MKEPKKYRYIKHLMAAYLYERAITVARFTSRPFTHINEDDGTAEITRAYLAPVNDPRMLAKNTAPFQKTMKEVYEARINRFGPAFVYPRRSGNEENLAEDVALELSDEEPESESENNESYGSESNEGHLNHQSEDEEEVGVIYRPPAPRRRGHGSRGGAVPDQGIQRGLTRGRGRPRGSRQVGQRGSRRSRGGQPRAAHGRGHPRGASRGSQNFSAPDLDPEADPDDPDYEDSF